MISFSSYWLRWAPNFAFAVTGRIGAFLIIGAAVETGAGLAVAGLDATGLFDRDGDDRFTGL